MAGHLGPEASARGGLASDDDRVQASALSALGRLGALTAGDISATLWCPSPRVRRQACQQAAKWGVVGAMPEVLRALADADETVVEAACAALGELAGEAAGTFVEDQEGLLPQVVEGLAGVAVGHRAPLVREAAVAALGAVGRPEGLAAVLKGTTDKPAVRRRAVIALAAFEGEEVERALVRARQDPDWQVRQAAEDLVGERPAP